ncbi:MAG: STT3 domain-containing protein [Candidatus Helarchaeota archaeon]
MGKTTRKIKNSLKSIFHRPTVHVGKDNILLVVLLICLIILAFIVRIFPILYSYPILKAFDPYIQYSLTNYIIQNGYLAMFTWVNYQSWWPLGYVMYDFVPGTPMLAATLYHILHLFGVNISVWDCCIIFPAVMGTAATVMMFFLGDILGDRKTGLLAAFLLALSPAYLQRTVAGFFDNETVGVFFIIFILYFFIRSLKHDSIISAFVAGLGMGALMCSWGAYDYVMNLLPLTALFLVLLKRYSRRLLINYTLTIGVGFFIGTRIPAYNLEMIYGITSLIPLGMIGFLFLCECYQRWKNNYIIISMKTNWRKILGGTLLGLIGFLGIIWLSGFSDEFLVLLEKLPFIGIGGRDLAVLNPLSAEFITQSVGEHLPSPWSVYYYNLHVLLIILPIGFFFLFKRLREEDLLIIVFGITTLYFAGSFIRLLLILAPAAALISSFGLSNLLKPFSQIFRKKYVLVRRRKRYANLVNRQSSIGVFSLFGFLLILYSVHGIYTSAYQLSGAAMMPAGLHDWEETWSWMRSTLPPGTVICSWWDYGYWITNAGNMTSNADNGTINATQIALIGRMFMADNELDSIKILKMLGSDYVLVHWGYYTGIGGDEGKWVWMLKIGYENPILNIITYPLLIWDYYNEQTGMPNGTFFQSTIWKMLTCGELYFPDTNAYGAIQQSNYLLASFHYRLHTNYDARGKLWKDHYPFTEYEDNFPAAGEQYGYNAWLISYNGDPNAQPGLKYFDLAFSSQYHLVKVYKINYELAELQGAIKDVQMYNNGISVIEIENTGETPFKITSLTVGGDSVLSNIDILSGTSINNVSVGEKILLRTTGTAFDTNTSQTVKMTIQDLDNPSLENPDISRTVTVDPAPTYNMTIIENETFIYSNETAFITVKNTNSSYIKIDEIKFENASASTTFTTGQFHLKNSSEPVILNANETKTLIIPPESFIGKGINDLTPNSVYNISIKCTFENLTRTFNRVVISNGTCLTLVNATAYGNESVYFSINNTGSTPVTIKRIYLGASYFNYYTNPGIDPGYVLDPGEIQNFEVNWYPEFEKLNLNVSDSLFLNVVTDETLAEDANASIFLTVENAPGYAVNITDEAFSNETLIVNVSNSGTYPVTVSDFYINNYPTSNFTCVTDGNSTLESNTKKLFRVFTTYNLNYTDVPNIKVRTFEGAENSTTAFVNFTGNVNITHAAANFTGYALVNVSNLGNELLVVKDFTIITSTNEYLIDSNNFEPIDGPVWLYGYENRTFNLTLPDEIKHATSLRMEVNVTTYEGAWDVANLTWNVGILIENAWLFENGTVKFNITNNGLTNVTLYQLTINQTETFWANSTDNMTISPSGVMLEVGQSKLINVSSTDFVLNNFSKYVLLNMTANYTSSLSDLVFASPQTTDGLLFILSENKNITIVAGYPYTSAFDNGSYAQTATNDTIKITVMNSGPVNITLNSFELFNGSWVEFNFTDLNGILSFQNYTLEPYDIITFHNVSINNNFTKNFIELNVTDIIPVRVNTTATLVSTIYNITVLNISRDIRIQPENITLVDSWRNLINLTLTNYGNEYLLLDSIKINGTALNKNFDQINGTIWNNWDSEFFTLTPGQTKMFYFAYDTDPGEDVRITVQTDPYYVTEGIFRAYDF